MGNPRHPADDKAVCPPVPQTLPGNIVNKKKENRKEKRVSKKSK
jgi:hypothetical protein